MILIQRLTPIERPRSRNGQRRQAAQYRQGAPRRHTSQNLHSSFHPSYFHTTFGHLHKYSPDLFQCQPPAARRSITTVLTRQAHRRAGTVPTSLIQGKPDLDGDLPVIDSAVDDVTTHF